MLPLPLADGVETTFSYDNQTSIFLRADGTPVIPSRPMQFGDAEVVSVNLAFFESRH